MTTYFSVQCRDTVGWMTGRAFSLKKLGVGLSVMMILLELCKLSPPPPSSSAAVKPRMEIFWYRLIQAVLENGR